MGTNEANWEGLSAISEIRRADRDHRLADYVPFAKRAYSALQLAESEITLPKVYEESF